MQSQGDSMTLPRTEHVKLELPWLGCKLHQGLYSILFLSVSLKQNVAHIKLPLVTDCHTGITKSWQDVY